jgi:HSP20 family protein
MNTGVITSEFPLMRRLGSECEAFLNHFSPALEMVEEEGRLVVRADVPGMKPDDLKVEVTSHELTIQGERRAEKTETERAFYRTERSYGSFFRSVSLPESVDTDGATATVTDGVLEIIMPIATTETARRRVAIREEREASAPANLVSDERRS